MRPITALFLFTVRQILLSRKIWLTLLLLVAPCALLLVIRNFGPEIKKPHVLWEMYHVMSQFFFLMGLVPLVCMVHGTALIGAEVEARTIVYLITRRMRRSTVLLVKYVATAFVLAVLCDLAMLGLYLCALAGRGLPAMVANTKLAEWNPAGELGCYLAVVPLAVMGFLAIFSLIGLLTARPLGTSVAYLVLVELILSNIPVRARVFSLMHQLRVTMVDAIPGISRLYEVPRELHEELYGGGVSALPELFGVVAVALALSCVLMTMRELVPTKVARE